ncbi:uncharacterized protein LOC128549565 [Mercenaria mercenaria]|uniref:uncharacterized protein LOC128549565 n=1 Tax=Mercenaria mercenaria TaxID=6596 RepID=UPI00234EBC63|nr:uncharacterized protein LOC128549565 [Mercenaria mercenaria]
MAGLVLVMGMMLAAGLHMTDCMVYHVTFLGRNSSQPKVGELHYQGATDTPTVTNEVGCIWEEEGTTNIMKLIPNGTCPGLIPDLVGISAAGFKVESPDDFILHVYQSDTTGTLEDGFLAIPDEHLGREYYVITYCSLGGFCQFAVVGTVDKTSVNIVFPRPVSPAALTCNGVPLPVNAPPGEPIPFSLNENEVLHIESSDSKTDLSGTYIASDHEVAVFVGARDVPSASGSAAYMIEQIPPVNKWGTDFVVAPNYLNDAGDIIKIVTKSEETTVHILGFSPFDISGKGESVEWRIDWEMHSSIHASKPILIVQVMSLNIYNDTTIVTGSPAMVLVPHIMQWTDKEVYSDCLQKAENQSVLNVVTETGTETSLLWNVPASSPWITIEGSDYSVLKIGLASPESVERVSHGVNRSSYGYCDGKSAVLLAAKWDWENEDCIPTAPVPGDGVDNDCDGKIDEDTCTQEDIAIQFTSTQNASTGETTFKSINVKGASPVDFRVTSCDIVVVSLQTTSEPITSYTAIITPTNVIFQVCTPKCHENGTLSIAVANCTAEQSYKITWSTTNGDTTHRFETESDGDHYMEIPGREIDYDVMFVTAFSQTAQFVIELPEKDCNKIKSGGGYDNFGLEFVVPVGANDQFYSIFLVNANTAPVVVDLRGDQTGVVSKTVGALQTENAKKTDFGTSSMVKIEATDEISVYVIRTTVSSKTVGHSVLPVDTLGPNYHVFLDKSLEGLSTPLSETVCSGYAITDNTESNVGPVPVVVDITKDMYNTALGHQKLLTANRPIAVFCGADDNRAQMPPRETLGELHYIPPLAFDSAVEEAEIRLVATEDSTVVIIRGNYDNLDTVELTGNTFTRDVVPDMLYNISSTKPIQVHLQIRSKDLSWASVVVIPPAEQYKSKHFFPGKLGDLGLPVPIPLEIAYSSAVNANGDSVTSQVQGGTLGDLVVQTLTYAENTFSLTLLKATSGSTKFIVASDVLYNDINKVCVRTPGTPGDGEDNDCDGLTDEEQCTADIIPGEIDADIDGSFNEDCANGTTPPSSSAINLSLTTSTITCPSNTGTGTGSGSGSSPADGEESSITIDNGMANGMSPPASHPNAIIPLGSAPSYQPMANAGDSVVLPETPTTTGAPGESGIAAAPVETCSTDCVCPCGWVNPPKNYTAEELKAVVIEIQEKLKVTKNTLSAVIRSKSSAKDGRTEAAAVGIVGVVFLVAMMCTMVLLDLTTLARDIRMLMGNLRQVFQP